MKQLIFVGLAAGVGGFAGDKLASYVVPKLPASASGPAIASGVRIGLQAVATVAIYGVLRNF